MLTTRRIGVFPAWEDNPYLNYLYLAPRSRGFDLLHATTFASGVALLGRLSAGDVFHMHWTAPIVQRAEDDGEARARLARFRDAIDEARKNGVLIVWTIHNVLPHDAKFLPVEIELCKMLAERADLVHALSPATEAMTAEHYALPADRVVRIPHPSYQGVYANAADRRSARRSLGVAPDERAVLFFGQMRPYKGLNALFEALDALPSDEAEKTVLLLAGRTRPEDLPAIEAALPSRVRVIRDHSFIPDEDVDRWFRAADVAVYPYRAILNSGSLHLAATFGVRALLPGEPHLLDEFDGEDWTAFYDPEAAAAGIASALLSPDIAVPITSHAEFSRRLSPWNVSVRFADAIDAALEAHVSATSGGVPGSS